MLIYDSLAAKESLNTTWFNRDRRGKRNVGGSGNRRWDVLWPICKWVFLFPQPFGILSWFQLLGPKGSVTHVLVQEGLGHFREIDPLYLSNSYFYFILTHWCFLTLYLMTWVNFKSIKRFPWLGYIRQL